MMVKLRHNPNPRWHQRRPSAAVDDDYEREVQRSTEKLERAYRRAQKRVQQAETRLERAKKVKSSTNRRRQVAELEALVELRRAELEKYERLMTTGPGLGPHRGRDHKARHRTGTDERLETGRGR